MAEALKHGFFAHPPNQAPANILEEFDDLVTLGIANRPPRNPPYPPPSWNPFEGGSIHHSNLNKPLPPKLILSRPELAGRSREETCLLDLSERDAFIRNVQTWCKKSATHLDGDDAISEKIRKILYDISSMCPRLQEKMNLAQDCIEWDREQAIIRKKEAESAKKIPGWDYSTPQLPLGSPAPSVRSKRPWASVSTVPKIALVTRCHRHRPMPAIPAGSSVRDWRNPKVPQATQLVLPWATHHQ